MFFHKGATKTLRIMKISALFLLGASLHVSAGALSQKITLTASNEPLQRVFSDIKAQTGYTFFYTEDELSRFVPVSLRVRDANLEEVLDSCFAHQSYTYTIVDKMIVVRARPVSQAPVYADSTRRRVSGIVKDENGMPLNGVTVVVRKTKRGTVTDGGGGFAVEAFASDVLVFSFIGMEPQEIKVGDRGLINVTLAKSSMTIEAVVVEGYGSAKKTATVVGSVSQISGEALQEKPVADVLDALQGKVPGLQVLSSSGEPSSQVSLSLNGIGSLSADVTPLFVLDGVPVSQATILSLNPSDIDNMTVLRDASATSIYGSRAANGVIYITSKKGTPGKDVINLQTQYGYSQLADTKFFNSFMNTQQLTDFWVATGYKTQGYIDTLLKKYPNDTKWYKYYYQNKPVTYQADLSLSGGTNKTTYFVSGSYFNSKGLAYRSNYDRYTFRTNLTSKVTPWLTFGLNLAGGYNTSQSNPSGSNSTNRGLYFLAQPFYTPINPATGKEYPTLIPGWGRYNPHYIANENIDPVSKFQFNPEGYLQLTPITGLTVRSQAGMDGYDQRETAIRYPSYQGSPNNGSTAEHFTRSIQETINNTAEYQFKIRSRHAFTALIGQEYIDNKQSFFSGASAGQTDDRLVLLGNGTKTITAGSNVGEYNYISYFGRIEYTLDDKYFFNVSGRQDASSLFGADVRTAKFGSVGALWQAKKENFLQGVNWLTDLAIRANYGSSGNSAIYDPSNPYTSPYQSLATVSTTQYNGQTGWGIATPGNPNLTWEKVTQLTLGAQFTLIDRAHFDVDVYNKVTSNMLVSVPYPYTTGFSSITSNVGSLQNRGINGTFHYDVVKSKDFNLTPYVTLSYNQEKVTKLFQGLNYWIVPNTGVCWVVGKPISYFYPIFDKVDPQTGNPLWFQPNTDPKQIVVPNKNPQSVTSSFDPDALQQNTGIRRNPPINGGFGLDGNWHGFYLNVYFSFTAKKYIINNDEFFYANPTLFSGFNQSPQILDYWKKPGDVARYPQENIQFTQFDSRLIQNASFMRLKVLTLGYSLPKSLLRKTNVIKNVRAYVTGRNLLTFTKYKGVDPEVDSNLELGAYPNTKQYVAGLDFTF